MKKQREVCEKYAAPYVSVDMNLSLGLARNAREAKLPLNGLRHPPTEGTLGWYIWAGQELSDDPGFFEPVHAHHLYELCPDVLPYLALPPGWRFLLGESGYADVWYDGALLNV
jgi:hypothetical protein